MILEPPYAIDSRGMAALIEGIPEQIEQALAATAAHPWALGPRSASLIAVGAMGGSAIAADLTAGLYADRLARPLVVVRDYVWPAFVTPEAFAVHGSYSGATEETLALYRESARRNLPRAALTTGGPLAELCERDGVPWFRLPAGMPPRAALFASWVPLTRLLAALGWCDDPAADWGDAVTRLRELRLRAGTAVAEARNPAKQLASSLVGRHVMVYAAGMLAPVATRIRQQLNENAKLPAHSAVVPELNHNEIVGWERPDGFHRHATVLVLRDREDLPENARRLELTADYARSQGADVRTLESGSGSRLARMAELVMLGDYVSLYLAIARGVDPTPIASIEQFKRRMAEAAGGV